MAYFDKNAGAPLKTAFEDLVADWQGVTAETTFGCPSYRADGTLFAVLVTDAVVLTRLPDDERERLHERFEVGPFQAGERTVEAWVQVELADVQALAALEPSVRASYEAALADED